MAKYIKVSSIGGPRERIIQPGSDDDKAVGNMISFWKAKLDQVLPDTPDLIVLPEACDRYSNHKIEDRILYYKARGERVLDFFKLTAQKSNCMIAYSAAREMPDGTWRNSTQVIDRNGEVIGIYNKNHLVVEETTEAGILCGKAAEVIPCEFGTIACAICFDLNFDELRLKYKRQKPDIIIFSSMYHGGLMQQYWAYSCRAHFVGCICGLENTVISPVGEILARSTNYHDFVTCTINLDCRVVHLDYNMDKLADLKAKYGSRVRITDPGYLGSVLISSETDEFSADDVIREFEIELLDDYMDRTLRHRRENIEKQ